MIICYVIAVAVCVGIVTNTIAIQVGTFRGVIRKEILVVFYAIAITVGVGIIADAVTVKI